MQTAQQYIFSKSVAPAAQEEALVKNAETLDRANIATGKCILQRQMESVQKAGGRHKSQFV
jgi:hypothetical protein